MRNGEVDKKAILDTLLVSYKAQPVGTGYIDIIVMRENFEPLAKELIENGFDIEAISWWEYIDELEKPNTYGRGGPRRHFYPGWFAETCTELDEVPDAGSEEQKLATVKDIIENKILGEYGEKVIGYRSCSTLTPAFWLKIDWKNVQ